MKLIVNADDFGYTPEVNAAVVQLFAHGLIDRTTAMVNTPYFSEACRLAFTHNFDDSVGVHFNITEGRAISPLMADNPRFCTDAGTFSFTRMNGRFFTKRELNAVAAECEDQIRLFYNEGIYPSHLDSHHHTHTEWFIFQAIEPVLRRSGVTSVRIAKNLGDASLMKNAYKTFFNLYLKRRMLLSTQYFGSLWEVFNNARLFMKTDAVVEVMTHPTLDGNGIIIDKCTGTSLMPHLERLHAMARDRNATARAAAAIPFR